MNIHAVALDMHPSLTLYMNDVMCAVCSPEDPDVELENWVEPGRPHDEEEKVRAKEGIGIRGRIVSFMMMGRR
jgi:hypothetical protein